MRENKLETALRRRRRSPAARSSPTTRAKLRPGVTRRLKTGLSAEPEPKPLLALGPEARPARCARSPSRDERPGDTVRTGGGSPPAPARRYFGWPDPPRNRRPQSNHLLRAGSDRNLTLTLAVGRASRGRLPRLWSGDRNGFYKAISPLLRSDFAQHTVGHAVRGTTTDARQTAISNQGSGG